MSKVIVKIKDEDENRIYSVTERDCVFKCPSCGKENKVNKTNVENPPICKCGHKMTFRWWADREDIEFEELDEVND
jgi:DNA-directed RNA polymerase subunit RPC12/RpoP